MRAPNVLSLVITSGCCLLRVVRAQLPTAPNLAPQNIRIVSTLVANQAFGVTWDYCKGGQCVVEAVTLLQVDPQAAPSLVQIASSEFESIIASSNVNPSSTYEIALEWRTTSLLSIISSSTIGTTFQPPSAMGVSPSGTSTMTPLTAQSASVIGASSTATSTGDFIQTSSSKTDTPSKVGTTVQSSALAPTATTVAVNGGSSGLSTGAKVGIAIGAIGVALIVLIGALLIWRRRRQQQLRALPDGMPYSHDTGSTNRDLTAEKEMNVINSPVDTLHNGYSAVPSAPHAQNQSQTGSWASPDEHSATGGTAAAAGVPYTDAHRRSYGSGHANSSSPGPETQGATPPPAASGSAIQRKPVGATSGGTTHHLREPGMSDDEVARLEEEERRLDEAIAEAERKRQIQG